jgi:glyoxylase-like metal-dependent hydrolase (beta-lactamase superfamily II)
MLVLVVALAASFLPWPLSPQVVELPESLPPAVPPEAMRVSALPTGTMQSSAMFAFRGGSPFDTRYFSMTAVLVQHPRGDLLIDTGFGHQVDEQVKLLPFFMQLTTDYTKAMPAAAQLKAQGYKLQSLAAVVLTHAHWDHVSGLDSLPNTAILVPTSEHAFIQQDNAAAALAQQLSADRLVSYDFVDKPYLGFARQFDVWGDGSVVLVPAPGHTPGSVLVFLTLPSGQRLALLGDLVWQLDGIRQLAEKPWLVRQLIGEDTEAERDAIGHVAAIAKKFPQIMLLPAHDAQAMGSLPVFPNALR